MIVMKFGGSSLASASAIRQVASIVQSQEQRLPVVIVSAVGRSTDQLARILTESSLNHEAESLRLQGELRDNHWHIAEELLNGNDAEWAISGMQSLLRDLHVRMLEVMSGERSVDPELKDWVLSLGEQLSSVLVAAAFNGIGLKTMHVDSRKLILTDAAFTSAKPKLWETYARIRWTLSRPRSSKVVVAGGFIASTDEGRTTTLGRGGSDLTASLFGAALNVEEIQIWKDVDGMLTCDPRLEKSGLCVKHLTFSEAERLSQSGAKILHPDTVAPARRLRIPIYLRNTFQPQAPGTRIGEERSVRGAGFVKSIACLKNIHLLRVRPSDTTVSRQQIAEAVRASLEQQRVQVRFLGQTDKDIVIAISGETDFSQLIFGFEGCLQVHLQSHQALITLVGEDIAHSDVVVSQVRQLLCNNKSGSLLPSANDADVLHIAIGERDSGLFLSRIHAALFSKLNEALFHPVWVSNPVKTLENVPRAISQSDGTPVRAGHRVLTLA